MPAWIEDHSIWEKAKTAVLKSHSESDEGFWAIVASVYEKMGGKVKKGKTKASELEELVDGIVEGGTSEGVKKGWAHRHHAIKALKSAGHEMIEHEYAAGDPGTLISKGKSLSDTKSSLESAGYIQVGNYESSTGKSFSFNHPHGHHVGISAPKSKKYFIGTFVRPQKDSHSISSSDIMNDNQSIISCHESGIILAAASWELDKPTTFEWMPGGVHTIRASYEKRPILLTVKVTPNAAKVVQASYEEWQRVRPKQDCFGCIEHREQEASVRLPKGVGRFEWVNAEEGNGGSVKVTAVPTGLGARNVNEKIHTSWSPSFTTDAEYGRAKFMDGRLVFPKGVRGSRENPAEITGCAFSIGSLTNKPAFRDISPVLASEADVAEEEAVQAGGPGSGWHGHHVHLYAKPKKLLRGGVKEVHAGPFDTHEEAEHWHEAMKEGQEDSIDHSRSHISMNAHSKNTASEQEEGVIDAHWSDAARESAIAARRLHLSMSHDHRMKANAHELSHAAYSSSIMAHAEDTADHHHQAAMAHQHAMAVHGDLNGPDHGEAMDSHHRMAEHHLKMHGKLRGEVAGQDRAGGKPVKKDGRMIGPDYNKANTHASDELFERLAKDPAEVSSRFVEEETPAEALYSRLTGGGQPAGQ